MASPDAISKARPEELPAACRLLFSALPEPDRTSRSNRALKLFQSGEFDAAGLLVVRDGSDLVGAILYQPHPGNAALVWPPGVKPTADSPATGDALVRGVLSEFDRLGVKQAQCLLPEAEQLRADALLRNDFRRVTRLASLCRPTKAEDESLPTSRLTFALAAAATPGFADVLMATYDGTLDCPELNGTRTADEVMAGNECGAGDGPPLWFLARERGEPVGLVMFLGRPRDGILELSYLGLVPGARRKGLGDELVRFLLRTSREMGAEWLILSADVRNTPALTTYRRWGFREHDRQEVNLWTSGAPARPPGS